MPNVNCDKCGNPFRDDALNWRLTAFAPDGTTHDVFLCYLCIPDEAVEHIAATADVPQFWATQTHPN